MNKEPIIRPFVSAFIFEDIGSGKYTRAVIRNARNTGKEAHIDDDGVSLFIQGREDRPCFLGDFPDYSSALQAQKYVQFLLDNL